MKRYLQIWLAQVRYSVIRDMMFKGTFLLWMIVETCWFVMQLCFIKVLYLNTSAIAGWSQWEMILLTATSQMITVLFYTFFIVNFQKMSELVRTGNLDFYLAQPVSPQFLITTRIFDTVSLVNAVPAIGLASYACYRLAIPFSCIHLLLYGALILVGVMVHYSMTLVLISVVFWITQNQGILGSYFQTFQVVRLPKDVFHGFFRILFTWVFPFLLMANVPAKTLIHRIQWKEMSILVGLTAILFFSSSAFFNYGLRRYTSASS